MCIQVHAVIIDYDYDYVSFTISNCNTSILTNHITALSHVYYATCGYRLLERHFDWLANTQSKPLCTCVSSLVTNRSIFCKTSKILYIFHANTKFIVIYCMHCVGVAEPMRGCILVGVRNHLPHSSSQIPFSSSGCYGDDHSFLADLMMSSHPVPPLPVLSGTSL